MVYFACFMIAMLCTMAMIPPLIKAAPGLGFVDVPDERKVHLNVIPRIGGVAMVIGALIPLGLLLPWTHQSLAILIAMTTILFFGAWDDRKNLNYKIKFLGQAVAALIVIFNGIIIKALPFYDGVLPFPVASALTLIVFLAITNAMNLVDGLDGLAGGTTLLSLGTVAILAWHVDQQTEMLFAVTVMGCILGFLRFNTHPAKVFMGDSGSQFLGFTLAVLMVALTQKSDVSLSQTLPFLLTGLPVLDTLSVMFKRIKEGRSPFSPDKNHLHHRLLKLGLSHYEVVIVIYLAQAIFVMAAYLMRFYADVLIVLFYLTYSAMLLFLINVAERHVDKVKLIELSIFKLETADYIVKVRDVLFIAAIWIFAIYISVSIVVPKKIGIDFLAIAIIAAVLSLGMILLRTKKPIGMIEKLLFYVLISVATYFSQGLEQNVPYFKYAEWAALGYLAFIVLYTFIFKNTKSFSVTTLDVLLLIVIIGLLNVPEGALQGVSIGYLAIKIAILFYAIELLFSKFGDSGLYYRTLLFLAFACLSLQF
ncbi:MAG TPA: MraY family glycosyltransferase [Methanosarcina sp.]|nr:MraY family glycosyltransferase [Methanosarcina sp.]